MCNKLKRGLILCVREIIFKVDPSQRMFKVKALSVTWNTLSLTNQHCSERVCVHGVCVFTAVCVHFGWVNAEH